MAYKPVYEDQVHSDARIIIAFNDNVGIACSVECAEKVIDDIVGDLGEESDAGYEPATISQVMYFRHCMGCLTEVQ